MEKNKFEFLSRRLRSREPAISATRLVLVHGVPASEAAKSTGINAASLSRSLKALRGLDSEIKKIYRIE